MAFARLISLLIVGIVVVPTAGCEILQQLLSQEFEVPLDLETPPATIDATTQVEAAEATMCTTPDSHDCNVVKALDYTDDEDINTPPRIPDEFPVAVTVVDPVTTTEETINVEEWAAESGLADDIELKQAIPMDITGQVGVDNPDAVEEVTFTDVALNWIDNSLTFDTVPMDLYLATEMLEDTDDPDALIESGAVEKIGTVPAQEASVAGEAPISFVEGGSELFNTALKNMRFTVVVALPPGAELALKESPNDENNRLKPKGVANVSLKATVLYTVSAEQIRERADEAQSSSGDQGE